MTPPPYPPTQYPPPVAPTPAQRRSANYLTPDVIIPCLIFFAAFCFIFLELILPEILDLTAFWNAPPGLVAADPVKTPSKLPPFLFKGRYGWYTHKRLYQIEPVSDYVIEARVLHTRHYRSDANNADLIPFDIGLGWGAMSDAAVLKNYFTFHHENTGGRLLMVVPSRDIPPDYYQEAWSGTHFSNDHVIPATPEVYETLRHMGSGDFVRLRGLLVNITRPDLPGWRWITTKRNREDAGKEFHWGSGDAQENMTDCDTMFVTEAEILNAP